MRMLSRAWSFCVVLSVLVFTAPAARDAAAFDGGAGGCLADGIPCNDDSDCCDGVCNPTGTCGCLATSGSPSCNSDADCCSGTCSNGTCTVCVADGAACKNGNDCCSGTCVGGVCGCHGDGTTCSSIDDCCTGFCNTSGLCGCSADGAACSGNADCCTGTCNSGGTCGCAAVGAACATATDCCDPICNSTGACGCLATGVVCTQSTDCCTGACDPTTGACVAGACTTPDKRDQAAPCSAPLCQGQVACTSPTGVTHTVTTTLQAAINQASSGDTILIPARTFHERPNLYGKALALLGTTGAVVDGDAGGTVLTLDGSPCAYVHGLTLQNGSSDYGGGVSAQNVGKLVLDADRILNNVGPDFSYGTGVYVHRANEVTITNSVVSDNTTPGYVYGGGIYVDDTPGAVLVANNVVTGNTSGDFVYGGGFNSWEVGSVTVTGNTFCSNSATDADGYVYGGGVSIWDTGDVTVTYNTVEKHAYGSYAYGAGILVFDTRFERGNAPPGSGGNYLVANNVVVDNTAGPGGSYGTGILLWVPPPSGAPPPPPPITGVVSRNVVARNLAADYIYGGGIMVDVWGATSVVSNTVDHNDLFPPGDPSSAYIYGGGIEIWLPSDVSDNLVTNNGLTPVGYLSGGGIDDTTGTSTLNYDDAWGNGQPDISVNYNPAPGGTGTISADPKYAGPQNLHLTGGSPAVDAGDPSLSVPVGGGVRVDIGAYELGASCDDGGFGSSGICVPTCACGTNNPGASGQTCATGQALGSDGTCACRPTFISGCNECCPAPSPCHLACDPVTGACNPPAFSGAPDPQGLCPTTDPSTCGLSGLCDGNGNCADYVQGTPCAASACSVNTLENPSFCDGDGSCVPTGGALCDPGLCSSAGGVPACVTACAGDMDCASDGYCDPASSNCLPKQPDGQPATGGDQCASGSFADGVCCDQACTGTCVACTAAAKGSGVDGACGPVQLGTNPHADCVDQGIATCGTSGTCDGKGACAFYPAGSVCAAGTCAGDTAVQPSLCDGNGACVAGTSTSCSPAPCAAGNCATMCQTNAQCTATGYCGASGTCTPKLPNGDPATGNAQCLSGFFADGVCCDTACAGTCVACTAAKKGAGIDGVCGPVHFGTDPDGECADQGAASCGTNGSCDGNGNCALYPATTLCSPASCQGNTLVQPSQCDGNGTCVAAANVPCDPGNCAGGICQLVCAVDADCKVVTAYCGDGMCQPKKPQGQPATGSNECLTGFVADGVCCDTACAGGACDACSKATGATADGTCTPLGGACDDGNPCTINDTCQGGVCVGEAAMDCPLPDACHEPGVCNQQGGCTYASKPNGVTCDNSNPCADATCQEGICAVLDKLDGAPCTGGVCIAGTCVLDPTVATTSSSSGTTGVGSTTTGGGGAGTTGGGGAAAAAEKVSGNLTGGGCLAVTPAEVPAGGGTAAFFAALFVALGRLAGRRRASGGQGARRARGRLSFRAAGCR